VPSKDPPGAPTLVGRAVPPPIEPSPIYFGALPRRRRRRSALLLPAVVAVGIIVAAIVLASWAFTGGASSASPMNVKITAVQWQFSGPPNCWSNLLDTGRSAGDHENVEVQQALSYRSIGMGPRSCTAASVTVATAGFTLVTDNAPLTIDSGTSATLTVTVETPSSDYTGPLTLDVTATSP
jgi:hypothetical protein